jgi:hypothetical protein
VAIAAGFYHSLGLKSDGSIVGWGSDDFGQATPPDGNDYVAIAAGGLHGLALKAHGSIVCWGYNDYGQATAPADSNFAGIGAGYLHSLALKPDGSIVGWGDNGYGQATPPAYGGFIAIAGGETHSLAIFSSEGPYTLTVQTEPAFIDTLSPAAGDHYVFTEWAGLSAERFTDCPDVYCFDRWDGDDVSDVEDPNSAKTRIFVDSDKSVTAVFVDCRECGDECHPYPASDNNKDCIVDFKDIALLCLSWLECTKPECD